jgi:GT2 family glycosyltransferase
MTLTANYGGFLLSENGLVSFVVIAYNEAGNIARTLASINTLEGLGKYEVIVVDDGSRDETTQIVANITVQNPCVRLIRLAQNHGRGYARSRGITEANGEFIATVDADIVLPPDWLLRAQAGLHDHDAVGGTAIPDGDVAYIHKRFRLVPRFVGHTTTVSGSNALYRRAVFGIVKFDPALREGEDVALNHATRVQGLSFATIPGLLVTHEENKTFGESLKWLFESGGGATRQLITYRVVRQPDLAAAAFVAAVSAGLYAATRGRRLTGAAFPLGFILAASTQHIRTRFETPKSHWRKVVPAVVTDSALLTAYFTGRLVGLKAFWRIRKFTARKRSAL